MPKAENIFKVLQLGTRLKQLKLQEEEKKREREREEAFRASIADQPELLRAYGLIQGGFSPEAALKIAGHISPEETKRGKLIGDIATVEAGGLRTGPQFMRSILAGEETPPETKERLTSIMDYDPTLTLEQQMGRVKSGLLPSQKINQIKLGLLQKLQREEEWTPGDIAAAGRIWPDKFASESGLSPSQQISQLKLGLLQKIEEGEEWTEDEQDLAKYMGLEKEKKPYITAPQMMNKFYSPNMLGMPMAWTPEQKMNNITAQEKIAVMSGDEAQLKEMDAVRVAEGFPTREQEQALIKLISGFIQRGDKKEQIEAGLRQMDYSNDYIRYLLRLAGVR